MKQLFNLKSYFTFLSRNKVYTAINVFGLSLSLLFVLIIGVYTRQEYSKDSIHSKASRIYAQGYDVGYNGQKMATTGSHWYMQKHLRRHFPDIENSCAMADFSVKVTLPTTERVFKEALFADSTFFGMFDFELVRGDRSHVLDESNSAVVTEELAKALYGNADPIGKPFVYNDSIRLIIKGVMRKMEGSSIKPVDFITRFEHVSRFNRSMTNEHMNNAMGAEVMFLMKPGRDIRTKSREIDRMMKQVNWLYQQPGTSAKIVFIPLDKLYFSDIPTSSGVTERGDKTLVNMLFGVEIIILLFSIFNYINLTVAQSGRRAKEMATRRLLGSRRSDIVLRLILESIILCLCSLVIAIGLSFALAPAAGKLLDADIAMANLFRPLNLCVLLAFVLGVGVLAGVLPAVYISRSKPIDVVRGTFKTRARMRFSRVLIILQSAATIFLLACSLTVGLQLHHLFSAPLGYDTDNLLNIENTSMDSASIRQFRARVAKLPCVEAISISQGVPLDKGNNETTAAYGRSLSFQVFRADKDFLKVLGIKIVQDNHVASADGVYLNRRAFQETGLATSAKSIYLGSYGSNVPIRGILSEFKLGNITTEEHPVAVYLTDASEILPWNYVIRIKGDPAAAYGQIRAVYKEVFREEVHTEKPFMDQQMQSFFERELRLSKIITLFASIAIVISMLGLVAMSMYFIQQRRKEIAVRKVFGSTNNRILVKLLRTFMGYVLIAFVVAVPAIYYVMTDWLSGYSYRITLSPWIYLSAGLFCLVLSCASVYFQSRKAANENPVKNIKEE